MTHVLKALEDAFTAPEPPRWLGWAAAIFAGIVGAGLAYIQTSTNDLQDIDQLWYVVRQFVAGENPYEAFEANNRKITGFPLLYPLSSGIVALPFAFLSLPLYRMVVMGISGALLGYALSRVPVRLFGLLSGSVLSALHVGQFSPLLTAAMVLPWLAAIASVKPNLGLAVGVASPNPRALKYFVIGSAVLGIISLIAMPRWPLDWLAAIGRAPHLAAPVQRPLGFLLLLAVLRWRRPEARMMLALACVPQTGMIYDTVPLFLVPRKYGEALLLTILSIGALWWQLGYPLYDPKTGPFADHLAGWVEHSSPIFVALLYMPCLAMILLRPNEGWVPAWFDRLVARIPRLPSRRTEQPS